MTTKDKIIEEVMEKVIYSINPPRQLKNGDVQEAIEKALQSQKQKIIEEIKRLQKYGSDGNEKIYYINAEELLKSIGEKEQ